MNQLREEIKGLGHSNQFAPLLGLTLGLLVGRVVGRSHVGKPLTSRDLGQLEGELKKLSAESVADENLKRSIEYLQKSVSTVMNRRKKQSASGQLFAESGFFAEKSFVAASKVTKNVDGNVLHKMVLATKLMVISSYFTMHVKKSEKTKAQAGKFFSKAPEDHVRALLESKIVQDALQAELKTKQKFWEQLRKVSNFRRPSRKPSRQNSGSFQPARKFSDNKHVSTRRADSLGNKRTVSVEIGQLSSRNLRANSVNSRLGPNLSRLSVDRQERGQLRSVEFDRKRQSSHRSRVILDSREVLRAAVAVDRVYSSFNHGNRVGLTFNGQQVDPLDMPAVFELTYVPKKTSNRQELLSVLVDSKHSTAVTVNSAGVLEVFDKLTRESKSSITMNVKSEASSVAIDGRWIFVGFKSGLINVYDRNTLACFQSFSGHAIKINELIAESGRLYAVGIDIDQEGVILVWDLGNWSRVGTLRGHSAPVTAISVDSHLLVTVDTSGELFFWDTEAALPTVARTTKTELGVVTAMEARDGEVYIGEKNGALSIWDSRTSEKEDEIEDAHLFAITAITLDEEYLFTGSVDRSLRAWDKSTLLELHRIELPSVVHTLDVDTESHLYSGDRYLRVWDIEGLLDGTRDALNLDTWKGPGPMSKAQSYATLEDAKGEDTTGRPKTLLEALHDPRQRGRLQKYLKYCYAEENLAFWVAVEKYSRMAKVLSAESRQREALDIVDTFILEGSPSQVNISGRVRKGLSKAQKYRPDSFGEAQREIFSILEQNHFRPFLKFDVL